MSRDDIFPTEGRQTPSAEASTPCIPGASSPFCPVPAVLGPAGKLAHPALRQPLTALTSVFSQIYFTIHALSRQPEPARAPKHHHKRAPAQDRKIPQLGRPKIARTGVSAL
jgi:hypothetical protein